MIGDRIVTWGLCPAASSMRTAERVVLQQLLGHDDPRTTSIYTAAHAEDLSAALADAGAL
jgi:integrase